MVTTTWPAHEYLEQAHGYGDNGSALHLYLHYTDTPTVCFEVETLTGELRCVLDRPKVQQLRDHINLWLAATDPTP